MFHSLPLSGIRVLDLTRVLAGPFCTQVLADLGADVVKVERPGSGDETRQWGPPFVDGGGSSAYYLSVNRSKRSLALDLSRPESRPVLDDLLRRADILVENFLPASLAKLGLDEQRVNTLNPKLVRASISGYGRTGPLADTPGYDLVIQATAGLMSITGPVEGPPMKVGVALTDVLTGLFAAVSALAGLVGRGKTGQGQSFDLALADCTLASLVNVVQGALLTGQRPQRLGNAHPNIVPYEAFAASDGHMVLAIGNDGQWRRFCQAAGRDDWAADPRFATNPERVRHRDVLIPLVESVIAQRTLSQWNRLLSIADVPHAAVQPIDETLAMPQIAARQMVQTVSDRAGRTYKILASPIHLGGRPAGAAAAPPELGEHTSEVLRDWLGYDDDAINQLRNQNVIP